MIPVFRPSYTNREFTELKKTLTSGWIGLGPKTRKFEEEFAAYIGVRYSVGVNSATAALELAFNLLDIKGREVITTPMTFVSTNHAIVHNGGIPVFADIEPDTLNINTNKIEQLITPKTRAICVVHYGGYACNMEAVGRIARKYGLNVIEDCAHACGGKFKGKKLGSIGDLGCFSFHAVKNLATGDGGMITTNNKEYYDRLIRLRWMGITKDTWVRADLENKKYSWYYDVVEFGYKMHMNDITATLGLVQLSRLGQLNRRRQMIVGQYNKAFSKLQGIEIPVRKSYMTLPSYHNYVIKSDNRDDLNAYLATHGIATGVHYIPNNHYAIYRKFRGQTPVCDRVWKKLLTLPLYPDLTKRQIKTIIDAVKAFSERPTGTCMSS